MEAIEGILRLVRRSEHVVFGNQTKREGLRQHIDRT